MPYIIETYPRPFGELDVPAPVASSSVAVATLDEARDAARARIHAAGDWTDPAHMGDMELAVDAEHRLPDEGGTIGPLPDGTVIEVRHVEWDVLAQNCQPPLQIHGSAAFNAYGATAILGAYNAQ